MLSNAIVDHVLDDHWFFRVVAEDFLPCLSLTALIWMEINTEIAVHLFFQHFDEILKSFTILC